MYKTHIENVGEEIEIEVDYDYQPYEDMTRHYPGCNEDAEITSIIMTDTGAEIDIIDDDLLEELRVSILEHVAEESEYNKYGYLLDEV
jgi:hypothetical protein